MDITTGENNGQILFTGVYENTKDPIWAFNNIQSPANLEVSTLTVNSYPAGNILLTHNVSSAVEYNAPLLFQRPPTDINEPVEALMMNTSVGVPTKPVDGEYITALKDNQTVYDDIAVAGLQIFGNQTVGASSIAYIDGIPGGDVRINIANGALAVSSLKVSTLFADTVVSTTSGAANSYTASLYMSTPILYTDNIAATQSIFVPALSTTSISTNTIKGATANFDNISTNYISTNDMYASTIRAGTSFVSTANISSLNAGNFGANRIDVTLLSSLTGDITFNLVSTLSLFGNVDVNLGLGNQLAGLIGGAASQGLGVALGGAALATGAVALITGRTSGGVNSNVFQTVNGTTQLQFSTIGTATTSVFLDTNSAAPGTTPALQTSTTINVPAGAYCVRSVSDPLNINNNVSTIQSFGQWVPVIQNNPTLPSFTTSTLTLSTLFSKSADINTLAVSSIGGNPRFSSIQMSGNLSSTNANATFTWGLPGLGTTITNTTVNMPYVTVSTLNVLGDTQAQQVFGLSGNFNTLVASNAVNTSFVTGSNWISTPQLTVSSINGAAYPPANFLLPSTLAVSTLQAKSAEISSLLVSSIGATVRMSSIQTTGSIISVNPSATLTWGSPGYQTVLSQTSTVMGNARAGTLTVVGDTLANQVFGASGNFNTVTGSNQINGTFITGSNWISTPALTISSINGAPYPPPNVPTPSTIFASSINMTGNLTGGGGYISWPTNSAAPWSSTIIGTGGIITNTLSTQTANISSLNLVGDINSGATANLLTINTSTLNASSISSKGGAVSSMVVSSLNGQSYPPPGFGISLPSSVAISSLAVNGGLQLTNPNVRNTFAGILDPQYIQTFVQISPTTTQSLTIGGPPGQVVQYAVNTPNIVATNNALLNQFEGPVKMIRGLSTNTLACDSATIGNLTATTINTPQFAVSSFTTNSISTGQILAYGSNNRISSLTVSSIASFRASGDIIGGTGAFRWGLPGSNSMYISTLGSGALQTVLPGLGINNQLVVSGTTSLTQAVTMFGNLTGASNATFGGNVTGDVITGRVIQATQNLTAPLLTLQDLNVQDVASISTGIVSSLFTNFINNLPYPPTSGVTGDTPSTMYASTVYIDGGLTVRGLGPNYINAVNISSLSSVSVTGLLKASTVLFNGGMFNTSAEPIITSNLSAVNINNVAFINGQIYPPPTGSTSIPSTLYASTVLVNGGLSVSGPSANISSLNASTLNVNGGQTITGAPITFYDTLLGRVGGYITTTTGLMQMSVNPAAGSGLAITAGSNLLSTLMFVQADGRSRFTSSMTVRDNIPVGTPSQAYIQTYITGSEAPAGSLITSTISTVSALGNNAFFGNTSTNTLWSGNTSTNILWAGNISTIDLRSKIINTSSLTSSDLITTSNINLSSINNQPYPLPGLTPIGAITIWAGGTDNGTVQDFAVPSGWLACDGKAVSQIVYLNLYNVIGNKYSRGQTPPVSNFFLPDLTFTVPMGTPYRNYASTLNLAQTTFEVTFQTWASTYYINNFESCWKISQTSGGTLNYGTIFPAGGFSSGTWPNVYVYKILNYDGYSGYVLVRSVDGVTPIPVINTDITATGNGVVDRVGLDYIYTLGTYCVDERPKVTHNQSVYEVATHSHPLGAGGLPGPNGAWTASVNSNVLPLASPCGPPYGQSTISTIATGTPGLEDITNIGTYTAPNFLNMLYIIKY